MLLVSRSIAPATATFFSLIPSLPYLMSFRGFHSALSRMIDRVREPHSLSKVEASANTEDVYTPFERCSVLRKRTKI